MRLTISQIAEALGRLDVDKLSKSVEVKTDGTVPEEERVGGWLLVFTL